MKYFLCTLSFLMFAVAAQNKAASAHVRNSGTQNSTLPAKIFLTEKPEKCPVCGKSPVAAILYGKPFFNQELEKEITTHKVILGGCMVSEDDPSWQCDFCKTLFYKK